MMNTETATDEQPDNVAPDEQRDGETDLQFAWFRAFLAMGPGRDLLNTYRAFTDEKARRGPQRPAKRDNLPGAWKRAAEKWQWHARAAEFDLVESDRLLEGSRARRRALSARLLGTVEKQIERAEQVDGWAARVMKSRLYQQTETLTDGSEVHVAPANWSFADGIRAASVAARSAKTAAELLETLERIDARDWAIETRAATERHRAATGAPDEAAPVPTPTEDRARENEMLNTAEELLAVQVAQGVPGVVERLLAIHDRRCRLNGLVKPFDPDAEKVEKKVRDFSHWPPQILELLLAAHDKYEAPSAEETE